MHPGPRFTCIFTTRIPSQSQSLGSDIIGILRLVIAYYKFVVKRGSRFELANKPTLIGTQVTYFSLHFFQI